MIGDMHSHQTLAEIRTHLSGRISIDDASLPPRGLANELRVQLDRFEHLGHAGRLRLSFSNGRLYKAVFSPSSPADYFARVEGLAGASRPAPGEVWFDPSTRVHLLDGRGPEQGVAWEDECIAEEVAIRVDHSVDQLDLLPLKNSHMASARASRRPARTPPAEAPTQDRCQDEETILTLSGRMRSPGIGGTE